MDVQSLARAGPPRRLQVNYLRWGAVLAGTIVGISIFLLLALLGVAAGLTGIDTDAPPVLGRVAPMTGLWTVVTLLLAVWLAANVAGRLSGLARRSDGILHGVVVWGTVTLSLVWLASTAIGEVFGGAFSVVGDDLTALAAAQPDERQLDALSATSWWLFGGLLLALGLGIWGGAVGVRATAERARGEHEQERRLQA